MFGRRDQTHPGEHTHTVSQPGISLAKGPAMLIGLAMVAAGLLGLLRNADLPSVANFPGGNPSGTQFAGIEMNGWTSWITIAAGALLLLGAAQHHLAKAMSLIVGAALVACAVLAIVTGDVLGLAAANTLTIIIWAAAGGVLLLNTLAPRRERTREVAYRDPAPAAAAAPAAPLATMPAESDRPVEPTRAHLTDDAVRRDAPVPSERAVSELAPATAPPALDEPYTPPSTDPADRAPEPTVIRDDADRERLLARDEPHVPSATGSAATAPEPTLIRDDADRERLLARDRG